MPLLCCFREVLRIDPDDAKAYNNLGVVLARQGENKEAVASFYDAIRIDTVMQVRTTTWGRFLPIREKLKMQSYTIEKHCISIPT